MIQLNDKARKYIIGAAIGFFVLGYIFFFGSNFLPQDKSLFRGNWSARMGVIFLAMALAILASIEKNWRTSIMFWIISATSLIGMFFLGIRFVEAMILTFGVGYILYKSFEEIKGFLTKAGKSYRQLRNEVEKN